MVELESIEAFLEDRHRELVAGVEEFAGKRIRPLPEPEDDEEARKRAREVLTDLGDDGWLDPVAEGDVRSACLIREALAAASPLADAVFALQALGATPLLLAAEGEVGEADTSHRERWMPGILRGETMTAFAMTEPEAGSDVASMTTTAERDGDDYVLDGTKTLISNAGIADLYVVFATTDPEAGRLGIGCFTVPGETEGLDFLGPQVMSAAHPLGEIAFRECRIPAAWRVGEEGDGFLLGMATLDRLRPTVAAAACGMASRALREAVEHARSRRQFGRTLADLQLIKDKLARMAVELDAARLLTYRAAWRLDGGAERAGKQSSMAKAFATEAAQRIVDEAVQILGGRGLLADHPVERLYRSVRALRIYEGTTEIQHLIVARHLLEEAQDSEDRAGS